MRITISTLFFYNPQLCKDFIASILPSLVEHAGKHGDQIHFVVSDNTPKEQSVLSEVEALFKPLRSSHLELTTRQNDFNLGFGAAHNAVFAQTPSDIFIVLNNDLFIQHSGSVPNWIETLCAPLKTENSVAVVGVTSSPSILTSEGEGRVRDAHTQIPDYAEGSILAIRSRVGQALGLFAPDLETAYFEDSDLCLRYRQAGHELVLVDIPHEHRRGSSSKLVSPEILATIRAKNKHRFLARWKIYLRRRSFTNRIFLDFTSGGWGDVVAAIPLVTGYLRDHPTAQIELQTNQVGLKSVLSFPRVKVETQNFKSIWQVEASGEYDRIFSLTEVDYTSTLNLGMQICSDAGVDFDLDWAGKESSRYREASLEVDLSAAQGKKIAVVHAQSIRADWEGRSLNPQTLLPTLNFLKSKNYFLVLLGNENENQIREICDLDLTGKTSLEAIFSLLQKASLFFGMDSGPLHVAQFFNVPTFAIFGATLPQARLIRAQNSYGFFRDDLNCIGCYHGHLRSVGNYCIRRDEACVKQIDPKALVDQLDHFLTEPSTQTTSHVARTIAAENRALAAKQLFGNSNKIELIYPSFVDARLRQLLVGLWKKIVRMIRDRLGLH